MSDEGREQDIRRILVALDASPHSLAALRAAAELANRFNAELLGLYVEDITLLRISELPLAREVSIYSGLPRQITRREVEQQLRTQARQARRAMESLAARSHVRWSFRVAQGVIAFELLSAAGETDLIVLGKAGWSRRSRLGSTSRALVSQANRHLMILQHGTRISPPITVVYDGSENSQRALLTTAQIVQGWEGFITVIILAGDFEKARQFQEQVSQWLRQNRMQARYRWLIQRDGERLASMAKSESCGLLVLPAESEILQENALAEVINQMQCPVLVIH